MKQFSSWLALKGYVSSEKVVFGNRVSPMMPYFIAAWIMDKLVNLFRTLSNIIITTTFYTRCENKENEQNKEGCKISHSYSNAMKMRAALTYGFGRLLSRGTSTWVIDDQGNTHSNPSISSIVSSYMISLKRRKVRYPCRPTFCSDFLLFKTRAGEVVKCARAITPELLKRMWESNLEPQNWAIEPYASGQSNASRPDKMKSWNAKGRRRRMLWAAYTIAFWCLLRSDEVLRIRIEDIEIISSTEVALTLLWRKTNQTGGE